VGTSEGVGGRGARGAATGRLGGGGVAARRGEGGARGGGGGGRSGGGETGVVLMGCG